MDEYVHSVRTEITKLILVGTSITYHATGDAWLHTTGAVLLCTLV